MRKSDATSVTAARRASLRHHGVSADELDARTPWLSSPLGRVVPVVKPPSRVDVRLREERRHDANRWRYAQAVANAEAEHHGIRDLPVDDQRRVLRAIADRARYERSLDTQERRAIAKPKSKSRSNANAKALALLARIERNGKL